MQHLSELLGVIGTIDPQTVNNSEVFSDVIDMSKYDKVMCVFLSGDMNESTGDLTARVVYCDSAGNNVSACKTATAISAGSNATDNKQIVIEVDNNDLAGGATNKDRYVKFGIVSGATGGPLAAVVLGKAKYGPASDDDLSSVLEIETDLD